MTSDYNLIDRLTDNSIAQLYESYCMSWLDDKTPPKTKEEQIESLTIIVKELQRFVPSVKNNNKDFTQLSMFLTDNLYDLIHNNKELWKTFIKNYLI